MLIINYWGPYKKKAEKNDKTMKKMNRKILFVGLVMMIMMVGAALGQNDCYNPTMQAAKSSFDKGDYKRAEQLYREASECYDCTAQQKAQARKQATECQRKIEADEAAKRRRQEEARQAEERRREEAAEAERKRKEEARLVKERRQREEALRQREEELNRREEQQRQREAALRREEEQAAERKRQEEARQAEERRRREEAERNRKRDNITLNVSGVEFKMVWVEGGTFTMGCTSEQGEYCYDSDKPAHSVTLSNYYIGETEVTQALWQAVMGNNPSNWKGDNLPVEHVSWEDAQKFIENLNRLTGRTFRLPTEAEWEYAARGGSKSRGYKYSGSNSISSVAWYDGNSGDRPNPVKGKQANELGLYDMSGNVWEWCSDWHDKYSSGSQHNPGGPSTGLCRVMRGGGWSSSVSMESCRVSRRGFECFSDHRFDARGFRLVLCP